MIEFAEKLPPEQAIEVSAVGNDSFARSLGYYSGETQLNPDPVLRGQAGNLGVDLYADMELKDGVVYSCLQTRRLAVCGLDWEVLPASADPRDQEVATWVSAHLDQARGWYWDLYALTDAIGKGFAVSEVLWGPTSDGRIGIADIRSRHPRRFVFDADNRLRLLTDADLTAGKELPDRKFLVHTFMAENENPYGRGVCARAYWYAWFKRNSLKFWAVFAEKFGSPTVVGKYPPGTDGPARSALLSALNALQQETAVTIPDTMSAEFLEAQRRGTIDTYSEFMAYLDRQITLIILGQTLTSGEGERSGSLALGRVHADVRQDLLEADAISLSGVFNDQLIPWLVDWNWIVTGYPRFTFKVEPAADLVQLATRDKTLQEMGVPIPQSYAQRTYGIPDPEGPDDVLEPVGQVGMVGQVGPPESDRAFSATDQLLAASGMSQVLRQQAEVTQSLADAVAASASRPAPAAPNITVAPPAITIHQAAAPTPTIPIHMDVRMAEPPAKRRGTRRIEYGPDGKPSSLVDATGKITRIEYGSNGRPSALVEE
jgi:phage gp29-like protein